MDVCLTHCAPEADAWIVPFEDGELRISLPQSLDELARAALNGSAFKPSPDALKTFSCAQDGRIVTLVLAGVAPWKSPADSRRTWLALAAAFRSVLRAGGGRVNVMLDNAPSLGAPEMFDRLAGLPDIVIDRAKELLDQLTDSDITEKIQNIETKAGQSGGRAKKAKHYDEVDLGQMSLFETVSDEDVLKELRDIDISNLTPLDALNTLYRLQTELKNRWSG